MATPPLIFAFDIEARGQGPARHGILSIGVCVGDAEGKVLEKRRFDLRPLPGQGMERRCLEEFWSQHKELYETLTQDARDPLVQMNEFRALLDRWDAQADLYLVCDNPAFDGGMLNYYLDVAQLPTLHYRMRGGRLEYRNVHDADSYGRGRMHASFEHLPENDAELIYRLHVAASKPAHPEERRE